MEKTKIDWAESTYNPVTGCNHNCKYCYARSIATRFGGNAINIPHILNEPFIVDGKKKPYPFGFVPTFHRYRLGEYAKKAGRNVFVCSMADLFGEWVPDEWLREIFADCKTAPQHNYLFLTKNPDRYIELLLKEQLPESRNMWYGVTVTNAAQAMEAETIMQDMSDIAGAFLSIEPILEDVSKDIEITIANNFTDWVIVGAETGNRKDRVKPKREWIEKIVNICKASNIPVFMKGSLEEIWGKELLQEYPERLQRKTRGQQD